MPDYPESIDRDPLEAARRDYAREQDRHYQGQLRLRRLLFEWIPASAAMFDDDQLFQVVYNWCHDGTFNIEQVRAVCEAYNGVLCRHDHETPAALERGMVEGK